MSDQNSIMNLVHLDDEVKIKLKLNEIRIAITKKISEVINGFDSKFERPLIKYVCELIEVKIKKEYKCNKLDFLFSILESIVKLNAEQKSKITEIVEHLVSRKEIRMIPIVNKAWHMAGLILLECMRKLHFTPFFTSYANWRIHLQPTRFSVHAQISNLGYAIFTTL